MSTERALRMHVEALCQSIGPRTLGPSLDRAADYIADALAGYGLAVERQPYDCFGRPVCNVVAMPAGARAVRDYWVVGAHYDTVPGVPGADDNASGVAVLLELGRRVAAMAADTPLRLVAFALEEPPHFMTRRQGSRVFLRRAAAAGDTVRGALVLEMVGYTSAVQDYPFFLRWAGYPRRGDFIGLVGNLRSRALMRGVRRAFAGNPALSVASLTVPFNGWVLPATRLSDHASFWDHGVPALMVTDTAFLRNPHYHTPLDAPDTLDHAFMAQLVRNLELAVADLAAP